MDYDINYLMQILNKIKDNPYGIRHTNHFLKRVTYCDIDMNLIQKKIVI